MRKYNLKYKTFLIVFVHAMAFSAHASETNSTGIVDVLTCNTRLTEQQAIALLQSDGFKAAKGAEDGFDLVKPVQSEGICIKQAKVVGAFGVLMVVGQLCDGKYDALKDAFERQFTQTPGTALEPGKLFIGKSATGEGVIYRGMATMPPKPMAGVREVAFMCARKMGGAQ
jgi:hypothetical protein